VIDFLSLHDELTVALGADRALAVITMLRTAKNYARSRGLSTRTFCQGGRVAGDKEYDHAETCPIEVLGRPSPYQLTEKQVISMARGIADKAMRRKAWNKEQADAFLASVDRFH